MASYMLDHIGATDDLFSRSMRESARDGLRQTEEGRPFWIYHRFLRNRPTFILKKDVFIRESKAPTSKVMD
jgi:hypothetical protein